MARKERDPIQELLRYVLVAGAMVLIVLVLTKGKYLMGGLLTAWLLVVMVRFKRASKE